LGEGAEAAQKRQLARTEPGDVGEAPGPRQNGEKRQQQNLIQRTSHFPCLPVIRHIIEKLQKNRSLNHRSHGRTFKLHPRSPRKPPRRSLSQKLRSLSPFIHPIALHVA
jgi:hypothetical protein